MVKTNKEKIMLLCDQINKKQGAGSIYTVDAVEQALAIPRWKTGIEDLDSIIGGGIPEGRTIEIYGAEGAGKTTLGYFLCALHDLCLYVPAEGTYDQERAKLFGNHKGQMWIYRGSCGEDNFNKIIQMAKLGMPLIVVDSVPSMIPRDDMEKVEKSANKNSIEEQRIGGTARLMEKYIPSLEDIIASTGSTVVFINQLRDSVQATLFGEKTRTPGGHRLKHSYSIRIQVARKSWVEIPNYNPKSTAAKEKIGIIMKMKITKSKVSNPYGECEVPLLFDRGFVSFDSLKAVREEIMKEKKEYYKNHMNEMEYDIESESDNDEWGDIDDD